MKVYVVEGLYDHEAGYRDRYILGVYTSEEKAQRCVDQFLSLMEDDKLYCARATCVSEHQLNSGWYEDFWLVPDHPPSKI